ncbi:MAG: tRNA pseudouridine(55) synthase TruB [Eubacteriales bacterium]|nr:tRNA pseudouridine(55) synthase TruB [Eubacteriales bacterium]
MKRTEASYNGVLIVNKPEDFTSFDVVAKLRGILKERRIGHGGTLDPMATGVLPVFVGGATKAADLAAAQSKGYTAGFALGYATDTQDSTGTVTARADKRADTASVRAAVAAMQGEQMQLPPMYSAIQVDGKRLYDLARKGITVERKRRKIVLHECELLSFDEQTQCGTLRVVCSKGTYVRTICNDLGEALGTYATMTSLVRTSSGRYTLEQAHTLEQIAQAAEDGTVDELFLQTDSLFLQYPAVQLDKTGYQRMCNGAYIAPEHAAGMPDTRGQLCRVYYDNLFYMLGRVDKLQRGGLALFQQKRFR